jgi:aminoglycoside phosphotransferase (APT) family kinase protein
LLTALADLPRTLLHGDVHRNNVIVDEHIGRLIDWGGAAYGMPLLDLVTPGPPGSRGYERYAARWRALTGESTTSAAWRRGYLTATVCTKVMYLAFAARHFGDSAAIKMFDTAARALAELERAAGG